MSDQQVMPALFHHCETVYRNMYDKSEAHRADGDDGVLIRVWEGFTTHLFVDLNLAVPYFTSVLKALKEMGCLRQLRRGGGNAPSQWELIAEPTAEKYEERFPRRREPTRTDVLEQQVKDLQAALGRVLQREAS